MKTTILTALLALCSSIVIYADPIPALTPRQVKNAFKELGFPEAATRYTPEQSEHDLRGTVDGNLFAVEMFGPPYDSGSINVISAMVQNQTLEASKTNELGLSFLCLAASLPFDESTASTARIWIAGNLGKTTEKMFGQVKLQLFAEGRTRILRISTEPLAPEVASSTLPAIKHLDPETRGKNAKIPDLGTLYADVEKDNGKPAIRDPDTGWATWPTFKVLFKDGRAAEVVRR